MLNVSNLYDLTKPNVRIKEWTCLADKPNGADAHHTKASDLHDPSLASEVVRFGLSQKNTPRGSTARRELLFGSETY